MRPLALVICAAVLAVAAPAALAQSRGLTLEIDRAQRVDLRAAAASVIVANPAVADVTVVDSSTLYVTGRGHGSTDIVVVDAIGRTLLDTVVHVSAPDQGHVRVWRGSAATEMSCGAGCAPTGRQSPAPAPTPDGAP